MMRLFLVRHGEAEKTEDDVVLSKKGQEQAKNTANLLNNFEVSKVLTSDYTRAKQTAESFKDLVGMEFEIDESLREIYRVVVGGPEKENSSAGREERDAERAESVFSKISAFEGNVAIFAHGNLIRYLLARFIGKNPKEMWDDFYIAPGGFSILEKSSSGKFEIKAINLCDAKTIKESFEKQEKYW
ncbi:MAG: histidine phosphatase family protein [Candidatus Pacearchaeota archaeon]